MKPRDYTGVRYGMAVGVRMVGSANNRAVWLWQCDCGETFQRSGLNVRSSLERFGSIPNCGCRTLQSRQQNGYRNRTHGLSQTLLYDIWRQMIRRCHDERCKDFPGWGGRGIRVCDEWRSDIAAFVAWAERTGYAEGERLSLDRKNNDGHYCPENCHWATDGEQARNRRARRRAVTC